MKIREVGNVRSNISPYCWKRLFSGKNNNNALKVLCMCTFFLCVINDDVSMVTTGSLPGTMVAHKLIDQIRSKCTPEETLVLLKELPNPLADDIGRFMIIYCQILDYCFQSQLLHV